MAFDTKTKHIFALNLLRAELSSENNYQMIYQCKKNWIPVLVDIENLKKLVLPSCIAVQGYKATTCKVK